MARPPLRTSGAAWAMVAVTMPVAVRVLPVTAAMPKSASLMRPKASTRALSGLMSRCRRSASWAVCTAAQSWMTSATAAAGSSGPEVRSCVAQGATFDELLDQVGQARVGRARLVDDDDVGVPGEPAHGQRLPLEAGPVGLAEAGVGEDLDGDLPPELGLVGPVDDRVPAPADLLQVRVAR